MTEDKPLYVFDMIYTDWNTDPYYYRDWHGAKKVEVVAATKQEAVDAAHGVLGEPPSGRRWAMQIKAIRDIRIPAPKKETS